MPYKLTVENIDTVSLVPGVTITDRLPNGFRYRKGSVRLNSGPASDPSISGDGRSVTFTVGDLAAAAKATITYVVEVGAGASLGKAVNSAIANGSLRPDIQHSYGHRGRDRGPLREQGDHRRQRT